MKQFLALSCLEVFRADAASAHYQEIKAKYEYLKLARAQTYSKTIQHETSYDLRLDRRLQMVREQGLTIKRNQSLSLLVSEEPETGYEWIVDYASANGLFKVQDQFVPQKQEGRDDDGSGYRKFTLRIGDKVGKGAFRIALSRPWQEWTVDQIEYHGDCSDYIGIDGDF